MSNSSIRREMENVLDLNSIKKKMLRKYPTFGSTINSLKYEVVGENHPVSTAATDGKTIFVNTNFMSNLPEQEQLFVFAHEVCHIALNHIFRSKDKEQEIWNIATDAVINQHLKNDGLPIVEGGIDIKDALLYDAEELYEKLLENKEHLTQQIKDYLNQNGHDNHSMWEDAVEKNAESGEKSEPQEIEKISEKTVFEQNQEEKLKRAEQIMSGINSQRCGSETGEKICLGDVGTGKPVINWKRLLIKYLVTEDEAWGHKFSDKYNGYAARIEDIEYDESADTEIILDTSVSISEYLLKVFLRQVKIIFKNSSVKVGTFSNEFNGWTRIKKLSDIDNIPIIRGGTNYNAASSAFSKSIDVNKICFTDGNEGKKITKKRNDIIWISFENRYFKPDYGKTIYVPSSEFEFLNDEENDEAL